MSIEEDKLKLKALKAEISELESRLRERENDKARFERKISDLNGSGRKNKAKETQGKVYRVDEIIKGIQEELNDKKGEAEILEIITSVLDKKKKTDITNDEVSEIDLQSEQKDKRQKTNPIRTIRNGIKSLKYNPQHAMPNKYVAKGKEMVRKIRFLASNVGKGIVTKILTARKNIVKNIENAKRLRDEAKRENKKNKVIREPQANESKKYTSKRGTRRKMHVLAAVMGLAFVPISLGAIPQALESRRNSALDESVRITAEVLEEMENSTKLREENSNANQQVEDKNNTNSKPNQNNSNSSKPSQSNNSKPEKEPDKNNTNTELNQNNSVSSKPSQSNNSKPEKETDKNNTNTELNQNNSASKPSQNNNSELNQNTNSKPEEKPENNNKPEDQIKKIYGGEISASENGILTEEDILYAATQMGWKKEIIDNIKEMMPGLLDMQRDFDVCPLVFLATAQGESCCGTEYQPGGSAYESEYDYRAVNIEWWDGQIGVVRFSSTNYGVYSKWSDVPYDFGNYLRNGPPYAESEKGAQTMADLQNFGKYEGIFNNAGTKYAAIFNQLKACLEKRVTKNDVKEIAESCLPSDIKDLTDSLIDEQKSANKGMAEIGG